MKYSIIIPLYNSEKYIVSCLDSIVSQMPNECELLLIDDGSTDKTLKIVDNYIHGYENNIKLFTTEHGGVSKARNLGIAYATGKYIMFIDSDDMVYEDYFEEMEKATKLDKDLAIFGYNKRYCNGEISFGWTSNFDNFKIQSNDSITLIANYIKMTGFNLIWYPWGKIFKKDIIDLYGVKFNEDLICCNDFNFFFKYFIHCKDVSFNNIPIIEYRVLREGSITKSRKYENIKSDCNSYYEIYKIIDKYESDEIEKKVIKDFIFQNYFGILHYCSDFTNYESKKMKSILRSQSELFNYNKTYKISFKRFVYKLFGPKLGAKFIFKIGVVRKWIKL